MRSAQAAMLLGALTLCTAGTTPDEQEFSQVELGRYLTVAGDCAACHTAKGGKPFAGGLPIETPFGNIVAPNITPDHATGLGDWTNEQFVDALQNGIGHNGEHLYPAMPYPYYNHISHNDALAIRAYLATIDPVQNKVVSNQLPFPLNIRAGMRAWNAMFFSPGPFKPDASKSAEWNRGSYLVNTLEHCGLCHTPKNAAGADDNAHYLQGAELQGWFAPNVTNDMRTGLGRWSTDDVATYLRTGHNAFAAASGPMAEAIERSTSQLTAPDVHAMAVYLKDLPGQTDTAVAEDGNSPVMRAGAAIYADECSACHVGKGEGVAALFPALSAAPTVQSAAPTSLIRVVLQGARSVATDGAPTAPAMPAFGWMMSDAEVAAVVTYIRNAWGNAAPAVTADEVKRERASLDSRTD
jgi:mono/diheme cytochrome c family protein